MVEQVVSGESTKTNIDKNCKGYEVMDSHDTSSLERIWHIIEEAMARVFSISLKSYFANMNQLSHLIFFPFKYETQISFHFFKYAQNILQKTNKLNCYRESLLLHCSYKAQDIQIGILISVHQCFYIKLPVTRVFNNNQSYYFRNELLISHPLLMLFQ